jgi:high-affinity iron transporter
MLPSYILALREGLEAALVIGIVLGVLRKMGRQNLNPAVWTGAISGAGVSVLAAFSLNWVGAEFDGPGEQLFEGITMLLAAGVLTWMVFWMRKQTSTISKNIETGVRRAAGGQGQRAVFFLAFLAVVREGIELAIFLLAARLASNPAQELFGASLGLASAVLIGWVVFTSSRRLSVTRLFQGTNILMALFAGGMVGLGIHEFNELGWIPAIVDRVWNFNAFLPDESTVGQLLKALVGYDSTPSLSQVIAYFSYFAVLGAIIITRHKISLAAQTEKKITGVE